MTARKIRKTFRDSLPPELKVKLRPGRQNGQVCDIRCAFVVFLDDLYRSGQITAGQAFSMTL